MVEEEDLEEGEELKEEDRCIFDDSMVCPFAYYKEVKQELLLEKYCTPCRIGKTSNLLSGLVIFAFVTALANLILLLYWLFQL
jgi:hypothetical protein